MTLPQINPMGSRSYPCNKSHTSIPHWWMEVLWFLWINWLYATYDICAKVCECVWVYVCVRTCTMRTPRLLCTWFWWKMTNMDYRAWIWSAYPWLQHCHLINMMTTDHMLVKSTWKLSLYVLGQLQMNAMVSWLQPFSRDIGYKQKGIAPYSSWILGNRKLTQLSYFSS